MQPPRKGPVPTLHVCPVCGHKQTKIQKVIGSVTCGSTTFICARAGECSAGVNLSQIATWLEVRS